MTQTLLERAEGVYARMVGWRRHIHAHPELSYQETATAAYIAAELRALGGGLLTVEQPLPNAVVAELKGGAGAGPTVALRADIDALPITEASGEAFASTNCGVMHACGHDSHTAMVLGAAAVLVDMVAELKGTVRFLFQPAEEMPPGGAKLVIEAGCLKGVDSIFGLHVMPIAGMTSGKIGVKSGAVSRSSDTFTITVTGRGGHASMPELTVDAVTIAAHVVTGLQTMVTRRLPANKAPVVSVSCVKSNSNAANVISSTVELVGTIRCNDKGVRAQMEGLLRETLQGITGAFGGGYELKFERGYDVTVNDADLHNELVPVFQSTFGSDMVVSVPEPLNGSEDFSEYGAVTKAYFGLIGCYGEGVHRHMLHTPDFVLDETAMKTGVAAHLAFVTHKLRA